VDKLYLLVQGLVDYSEVRMVVHHGITQAQTLDYQQVVSQVLQ
jgi:hypothetical protein